MKVLEVLTYYRPWVSGLTIYVERLSRALVEQGHDVTVLTSQYDPSLPRYDVMHGVKVVRIPVALRISKGVIMPDFGPMAWKLSRQTDVLHLHLPQFDAPGLALRFGARGVLAGGLAVAGAGLLLLYAAGSPLSYPALVGPLVLAGAGMGSLAVASAIIMGASPPDRAGDAAAIEESMYDLGNVLGIAALGSLAAALYRRHLAVGDLVAQGLPADSAAQARESLIGALHAAGAHGSRTLAQTATEAFTRSMGQTALVGGLVLLACAAVIFRLIPRGFSIADPPPRSE